MSDPSPPYDLPLDPAVRRNAWRTRSVQPQAVPSLADSRKLLPVPILPERPDLIEMYWRAWEMTWHNLQRARPAAGLPSLYLATDEAQIDLWSSALSTPFLLYARRAIPPLGTLDCFYAHQLDDGYISRAIQLQDGRSPFPPFDPNSATLPLLSWAEWGAYRATGDEARLVDAFWPLLGYHRWLRRHRSWPDGLYWTTGLASSTRGCARVPGGRFHHQHWAWVDATIMACLDAQFLGMMAAQLEEPEAAQELSTERRQLLHLLDHRLWHEEQAFFLDRAPDGAWSPVQAAAALWALHDRDLLSSQQLEGLVRRLRAEDGFAGPMRVPCRAATAAGVAEESGPPTVWPGETYAVVKGLRRQGHHALAHDVARNHVERVAAVFVRTDTFWRFYDAAGVAPGAGAASGSVAPGALAPIALLIEDVIGLQVDWPQRRVLWDRRLPDPVCGVDNLPLGGTGRASLRLQGSRLTVESDSSFTLQVVEPSGSLQVPVSAGTVSLDLA